MTKKIYHCEVKCLNRNRCENFAPEIRDCGAEPLIVNIDSFTNLYVLKADMPSL